VNARRVLMKIRELKAVCDLEWLELGPVTIRGQAGETLVDVQVDGVVARAPSALFAGMVKK